MADTVAPSIARQTAVSEGQVRPVMGGLFSILTIACLVRALGQIVRNR